MIEVTLKFTFTFKNDLEGTTMIGTYTGRGVVKVAAIAAAYQEMIEKNLKRFLIFDLVNMAVEEITGEPAEVATVGLSAFAHNFLQDGQNSQPGGFEFKLYAAFIHASEHNRKSIIKAFPEFFNANDYKLEF